METQETKLTIAPLEVLETNVDGKKVLYLLAPSISGYSNGFLVATANNSDRHKEYLNEIKRTVNLHEALLEAAKRAEQFISEAFPHLKGTAFNTFGELRDAIALAEGGK